ncbi:MAG: DUF1592 domain-containing protein [Verrucomicrobiales bacterium]
MVNYSTGAALILTCLFLPGTSRGQDTLASGNPAPTSEIHPFLKAHCFDCHDADTQDGDLNLEELSEGHVDFKNGPQWATVLKRIEAGEMPPKKKKRPSEEELRKAVAWLTSGLDEAETAFRAKESRTDLRRLTRLEYRNTMRDLIGHPYDPTDLLSPDPVSHGFDNIGEALVVSPFHVENFVKATDRLLDKIINIPDQPPLRQHWRIINTTGEKKPLLKDDGSWHDGHRGKNKDKIKPGFLQGNAQANAEIPSGVTPYKMVDLAQDSPVEYEGSWDIRAYGGSQIDEGVLIREGDNAFGFKWFAYEEGTYRIRIHLSTFGPGDWKGLPPKLGIVRDPEGTLWQEHLLDLNKSHTLAIDLYRDNIPWYRETNGNRHWGLKLYYQLTQEKGGDENPVPFGLHISHIDIEGPYNPEWPPAWHRRVFPEQANDEQEEAYAKRVLAAFMKRAFRRPVGEEEVGRMLEIYQKQRATGLALKPALRMPLAAILSSPSFLYHGARPDSAAPGHEAWELASRLSYFLWRSMPDERLFELAQSGELMKPETITSEIQRMLKDPKAETLIEHFTSQWLGLDKLSKLKVDDTLYPSYDLALREAMVGEATAFFREILQNDLSLDQFIHSDFLMLNERIAKHYGIDGVSGSAFRKVPIGPDHPRGGVMTQAGVLTATANGLRTLPITRGAFVLEQILADPPKPPPPDVPAIDNVAVAKPVATLRERLEQHRNDPSCINCHEKIDPPGFALESFDAIGTWRSQELVEVDRDKQENQVFTPGEVITIHFANGSGEGNDRIAVLPAAETDNKQFEKLDIWKFTTDTRNQLPNGLFHGIVTLTAPQEPGDYEARFFLAGRHETVASQRLMVAADGQGARKAPLLLDAGNPSRALAWAPVDATGTLPDGRAFKDVREFKKLLMENKEALLKSLTEKMLVYATGNTVSFGDRTAVNTIVKKLEQTPTLRTLIEQIVFSDRFLERTPQS